MLRTQSEEVAQQLMVADDVDDYATALPGFHLNVVRTGLGRGPNIVRAAMADGIMLASSLTQFPLFGQTTVSEDHVVVGLITAAPEGIRWNGDELSPGTVLLWGPGAEHTGVDLPGLRYVVITMPVHRLQETADRISINLALPKRGMIVAPAMNGATTRVQRLLAAFDDPRRPESSVTAHTGDTYHVVASMLSAPRSHGTFERRKTGNRRVASVCIEHANGTGGLPSISELCGVAHVSERKLREAFVSTFGVPPSQYFRLRALDRSRIQLAAGAQGTTIDEVALAAGFNHQGRFARYYFEAFGELPSETLRRA